MFYLSCFDYSLFCCSVWLDNDTSLGWLEDRSLSLNTLNCSSTFIIQFIVIILTNNGLQFFWFIRQYYFFYLHIYYCYTSVFTIEDWLEHGHGTINESNLFHFLFCWWLTSNLKKHSTTPLANDNGTLFMNKLISVLTFTQAHKYLQTYNRALI